MWRPPCPETSSAAAGLGSSGGDNQSAGPAPLSPPPGPPSGPAKTGSKARKGRGLKKGLKAFTRSSTLSRKQTFQPCLCCSL